MIVLETLVGETIYAQITLIVTNVHVSVATVAAIVKFHLTSVLDISVVIGLRVLLILQTIHVFVLRVSREDFAIPRSVSTTLVILSVFDISSRQK